MSILSGKQPNAFSPEGDNRGQKGKMYLRWGLVACALLGTRPPEPLVIAPAGTLGWRWLSVLFLWVALEMLKAAESSHHASSCLVQKRQPLRVEKVVCFGVREGGDGGWRSVSWSGGQPGSLACPLLVGTSRVPMC